MRVLPGIPPERYSALPMELQPEEQRGRLQPVCENAPMTQFHPPNSIGGGFINAYMGGRNAVSSDAASSVAYAHLRNPNHETQSDSDAMTDFAASEFSHSLQ